MANVVVEKRVSNKSGKEYEAVFITLSNGYKIFVKVERAELYMIKEDIEAENKYQFK